MTSDRGVVEAVSTSPTHSMAKPNRRRIRLLAGLGVEGDAHQGITVKHRSRVARDPNQPNLRQVYLIPAGGAAGGLVGPVLLLALRGRVSSLTTLVMGAMTMSAGMAVFAFSPSLAVAVAAYAVIGATGPVGKPVSDGYMQLAVDPAYRGRVGSLTQVLRGLGGLSALLAGGIAQLAGVESALVFAAVITGMISIWLLLIFKQHGVDGW